MKDYKIPGTDLIIEKGITVQIPAFALHRDEKYFENPNDFIPERFNNENTAGKSIVDQPYFPFGDGPRNCIGVLATKSNLFIFLNH